MKSLIYPIIAGVLVITSAFTYMASAPGYKLKDGYSIEFKSKDPSGTFTKMGGTVKFDEADLAGWFNAAKYPQIKYTSTKIDKSGNDYIVYGNITMKGVTKEKKVNLKVSKSGSDLTFTGTLSVNRLDFKVGKASEVVPNTMNITYSIPVSKI
jgi:polyisoprenoid-binding protein YceI